MLAHDVVAGPLSDQQGNRADDVVVFAHGILGSRGNWKGFARRFIERAPREKALLVDLRNHGQSHGLPPPHTVEAAADDVAALCRHLGLRPRLVVGHSWGGKAMLDLALRAPTEPGLAGQTVDVAVIVDSPPGPRVFGASREEIDRVIEAVSSVPLPVTSRRDLVTLLRERGLSEPIAQWMTTNLDESMRWKFDLAAIPPMLTSFGALDLWPRLRAHRPGLDVHLVRGGRSDRWSAAELQQVQSAAAAGVVVDHVIENAGHWVHSDDPESLLQIVLASLPS